MKLLRYGAPGAEKPGCLDASGNVRDLSQHIDDISGKHLSRETLKKLQTLDLNTLPLIQNPERIGACVNHVGKFICIGLNYADHAAETNSKKPDEPIIFAKATSAISGPHDPIIIPKKSTETDWEVELGVVIGTPAKRVAEKEALDYVAGYCVIDDVSERYYQKSTPQWMKGKSCDTFGPIGPWLVTRDEISDPQNLSLWLEVDGKRYQEGHTSNMIFGVAYLVSYLSQYFTLHPGDIISTGTPAGVGMGQKPNPIYLKAGQKVHLGIEGLGEQLHMMEDEK
ncbi:MAG: fumarylacetoacetate hydrolase family protein [Gammaproteobacteria bacterium]|nr:fumarylacetoacetate hydrolase family protein [Gammaproteobacteria bacterium]